MRCSGARVFRTPSHLKESFTAAIVVRSLWAALRSSWFVGLLAGWVVVRLVVRWPVSWDVVVAVDIGTCDLREGWMEGPAAKCWQTGGGAGLGNPSGWRRFLIGVSRIAPVVRNENRDFPGKNDAGQWLDGHSGNDYFAGGLRPVPQEPLLQAPTAAASSNRMLTAI